MNEINQLSENELHTQDLHKRANLLFLQHQNKIFQQTDRLFAGLMVFQWIAGIAAAYWISPLTWKGSTSQTHLHLWLAVVLGGLISFVPVGLAVFRPGYISTRHAIAAGQALTSSLLIHLTGGRIETHFHIFGSLAFLSFYRDWKIILNATLIVAVDHFIRGLYWPQSIFGVITASEWRWLEHAGWVIFEDIFLFTACLNHTKEMKGIAQRQAQLEKINEIVEVQASDRNNELRKLSSISSQISKETREQVTQANEIFSAVKKMNSITKQNTENVEETEGIALAAADSTQKTSGAVKEALEAMKQIIAKITIVEEIGRQTNLLALNAMIEASKAEKHGRGFEVIASQVRELSVTSQSSAQEITDLSNSSAELGKKAKQTLDELVEKIQQTAHLMQQINSSNHEQNKSAENVGKIVEELNGMILQNDLTSQGIVDMVQSIWSHTESLSKTIETFKMQQMT